MKGDRAQQDQCEYIQIINILSKMEALHAKWRCFHESAKNIFQSPDAVSQRFRSSSKDFSSGGNIPKSISSIGNLLISPSGKQKLSRQSQPIEYYQVTGKENIEKVGNYVRDPCLLRKQLAKIGESKPQDKAVVDAAITLIHNYEQKIKSLQEQLVRHQKHICEKKLKTNEIQLTNDDDKEISSKKCFGSEKTVSSLPSGRKITDVKSTCAPDYYFCANRNGQ